MRAILLFILSFLALYIIVVTSLGYRAPVGSSTDPPEVQKFNTKSGQYFLVSGIVTLSVIGLTMLGVVRESPTISMLCSIFMLLAVAQSLSNVLSNQLFHLMDRFFVSPAAVMTLIGVLLTIYTSLIWSSEFETPPHVIEEYKWYLNQIRTGSELDHGRDTGATTLTPSQTLSVSAAGSATHLHEDEEDSSLDDMTSLSYYSSKSSN